MGRKAASDPARNEQDNQRAENDLAQERGPCSAQEVSGVTQEVSGVTQEVMGPEEPEGSPGCQEDGVDAAEAELADGMFQPYAVTAVGRLRLRRGPSLDAPIVAELPCGAGVYADGEAVDGWLHVYTGRLEGFMMARYLEALPLPGSSHDPE